MRAVTQATILWKKVWRNTFIQVKKKKKRRNVVFLAKRYMDVLLRKQNGLHATFMKSGTTSFVKVPVIKTYFQKIILVNYVAQFNINNLGRKIKILIFRAYSICNILNVTSYIYRNNILKISKFTFTCLKLTTETLEVRQCSQIYLVHDI